ncbi:S8 family peptidase [Stigmatella aurantiaca]|uniref:Subtilisin n=1 Tax=Stigmatella aurantiaca (strain DW4/3-1) TaxID=378806 RepID=Q08XP9_STIAD|nr:S8 family peptidase [Stigmatella aurantiaca]ADO75382.1 Peptidase, S8A (Subtilisin) subfamily [Stigmatella aurantiaca DW4/3-1]EAU65252.1 subtilisin [Stigmatella aurantiaca DW4/3-1]
MTTVSKLPPASRPTPSSRSETETPRPAAAAAPARAEVRPPVDGFDGAPAARANFVDRPGKNTFVDRPTGLRPTSAPSAAPERASVASLKGPSNVDAKPPVKPSGPPVVAIFDGGVDTKHTDLDGALWTNPGEVEGDGIDNDGNGIKDDIHGFNVGFNSGDPMQGAGTDHGTHVAGIIAAEDNGKGNTGVAAGKAQVLSVGGLYDGADLLTNFERSVDYVVDLKNKGANIRAVNASFGDEYRDAASQKRWNAAVQKLADADILLVAATANGNGSNMNNVKDFPANVDLPNVITVASMDKKNDKLASYSSHGDKVVELAAVGEDVLSTVPGNRWEEMSGTSMATPRVAATAALMFAENPNLTAAQVRDMLVKTVEVDPDLKGKVSTGGKLDIEAAVAAARASAAAAFAAR